MNPLLKFFLLLLLVITPISLTANAATSATVPTEREWIVNLVDTLGYADGLSDHPQDEDYLALLDGNRLYRFEAENVIDPADLAAINNFDAYGCFSGEAWVCGLATPTRIHLHFQLPHSGDYRFVVSTRVPGHRLQWGGRQFSIDDRETSFHRVDLGTVSLHGGAQTIILDLPPNGSIDYLELSAPPLPRIAPIEGWNPESPLTLDVAAQTTLRALNLEALLPPTSYTLAVEAEEEPALKTLITDQQHLGAPSGKGWVRTGPTEREIVLNFTVAEPAVYRLTLRGAANKELSGQLNRHDGWSATFPTYLAERAIGSWYLSPGRNSVSIRLPSRGGVDVLTLQQRRSASDDYLALAGLSREGGRALTDEANRLITLLARLKTTTP